MHVPMPVEFLETLFKLIQRGSNVKICLLIECANGIKMMTGLGIGKEENEEEIKGDEEHRKVMRYGPRQKGRGEQRQGAR